MPDDAHRAREERVEVYYSGEYNAESAESACGEGFPEGTFAAP